MDAALALAAGDPAADARARERTTGAGEACFLLEPCRLLGREEGDEEEAVGLGETLCVEESEAPTASPLVASLILKAEACAYRRNTFWLP